MNEIIKSKKFKVAAGIVGAFLCALIIFALGISVGMHKGKFSCNWGKNYEKNFMGKFGERDGRGGQKMMDQFGGKGMRNAHGIAGGIVSVADNKIVIKNPDNQENTIAVTEKTLIKSGQSDLKITDLKSGDQIVVMGKPDESGVVNADLIRVFAAGLNNNPVQPENIVPAVPVAPAESNTNATNNSTN